MNAHDLAATVAPFRAGESAPPAVRLAAWGTLAIVLATIVMGAVVRATHSGDGCGQSWPACDGSLVLPGTGDTAMLIEFSHRAISGVSLLAMAGLLVLIHRAFAVGHAARRAAWWSMAFLIAEALIGAVIVLYGWVADDRSVARQVSVPLHLVNTFLLTAAGTLTVWLVEGGATPRWVSAGRRGWMLVGLAVALLVTMATGATTSLADTLFAAESLSESVGQDGDARAELIVRLRVLHPIMAITTGMLLAWFAWRHLDEAEARGHSLPAWLLIGGVVVQSSLGFLHIALQTPLMTVLLHLFIAQALWIALVWMALALLAPREAEAAGQAATPVPSRSG